MWIVDDGGWGWMGVGENVDGEAQSRGSCWICVASPELLFMFMGVLYVDWNLSFL